MTTDGNLINLARRHVSSRSEAAHEALLLLCSVSTQRALPLYLVGGVVRDALLDAPGQDRPGQIDLDLAVDASPEALYEVLSQFSVAPPVAHDRFGTASVTLADGTNIDIARTRAERYSAPGVLPEVWPAPIEVDLRRRDFSINSIALALTGAEGGRIYDPFDGIRDVSRRVVRTLHPVSFRDDPTRLVRAARYAVRIEGRISRATLAEAARHRERLTSITAERFGDAWRQLLREPRASAALGLARRLRIPQSRGAQWRIEPSVLRACADPLQCWAAIGLTDRTDQVGEWLPRVAGLHRVEREALFGGQRLRRRRRRIAQLRRDSLAAAELRLAPDAALNAAAKLWSGRSGKIVAMYLARRGEIESPVNAERLIDLGMAPGPELGRRLRELEDAVWDGEIDPYDAAAVTQWEQRIVCGL